MFKPVRVVATVLLFASIAMTFVSAFVLPAILCIVFVIVSARKSQLLRRLDTQVQYLAFLWYSLSYIPYARTVSTTPFVKDQPQC